MLKISKNKNTLQTIITRKSEHWIVDDILNDHKILIGKDNTISSSDSSISDIKSFVLNECKESLPVPLCAGKNIKIEKNVISCVMYDDIPLRIHFESTEVVHRPRSASTEVVHRPRSATSEKNTCLAAEKIGMCYCAAVLRTQVPKLCTDLDLSLLYILISETNSKFARKNNFLALGVCFPQTCSSAGCMFAASKSRLHNYWRIVSFPQQRIRWNAL